MVEVVFENFVNYLRSGNTDKLNIISFQQNQQHKINLSTQLIFYRILTKTVVQLIKVEFFSMSGLKISVFVMHRFFHQQKLYQYNVRAEEALLKYQLCLV
ncbi:Hypothetical_protein [Hexamita inflata]|uniref:Hypothetical_protein n=1 Tax=Hexamita inflata TaxID=28002 RepID=A0AA86V671_9EUKA|nr:Hypothetical protein HINF_LOCUS65507 [Hexamita inflata]